MQTRVTVTCGSAWCEVEAAWCARHCDLWVGLVRGRGGVDGSSSSWHWVGDIGNARTPSYTNWNVNEPNNANSYEHCTQMLWIFSWRWNDAHCNYGSACYVCQAKPAPPPHPVWPPTTPSVTYSHVADKFITPSSYTPAMDCPYEVHTDSFWYPTFTNQSNLNISRMQPRSRLLG